MIIFFILRRRKGGDEFDGNFDPDRFDGTFDPDRLDPERFGGNATKPGPMPGVDLNGAEVTPFQFHPQVAHQRGYEKYPQMVQQPGMPVPVARGGGSGYGGMSDVHSSTTGSHYPTTVTDQSITGMQNPDFRNLSPDPSLGTSATLQSAKERELASEGRSLHIANDGRGEGGSSQARPPWQHRDAGRVQQQSVVEEVPPSYDSIPPDEDDAAGRT